jgi:hypothetical protein
MAGTVDVVEDERLVAGSRQPSSKSAQAAGFAWAVSLGFIVVEFVPFAWWHPYCDRMDDGPGYFAYGLPFPFRAFSGVSSLEYNFLPFVYLLDHRLDDGVIPADNYPRGPQGQGAVQDRCILTGGGRDVTRRRPCLDQRVGNIESLGYPVADAGQCRRQILFVPSMGCEARFGSSRVR